MADRSKTQSGKQRKPKKALDIQRPEKLTLNSMAKIAEELGIPLWMMMIPDLAKHRELLKPGALKPLQAIVEKYLETGATQQTLVEKAYNDVGEIDGEITGLESLARCVHMAIDSAEATDTDDDLCAARSVAHRLVQELRRLSEQVDQLSIKLHHARWQDGTAEINHERAEVAHG